LKAGADKLPSVTFVFWVLKICATTLGETAGDLLSMTLRIGYAAATGLLLGVFVATLAGQLLSRRHRPWLFWSVILSTSTAGTTMSDFIDRSLGLGYALGSGILLALLLTSLLVWKRVEGSISVGGIRTFRAELLYWITILFSNTLGTALGDFLADDSGLGFAGGAGAIGVLLAATFLLYRFTGVSRTALFWVAFVLTRPFGATMGDVLTKPASAGGLGLGTAGSSAVLAGILVGVLFLAGRALSPGRDRR